MRAITLSLLTCTALVYAFPQAQFDRRQNANTSTTPSQNYTLPAFDPDPAARATELKENLAGYQYNTSKIGNSSFSLGGPLGNQLVQKEVAQFNDDAKPVREAVRADAGKALQTVAGAGGLKDLSSYELLYKDQWKTSHPDGVNPGILSNYTDDLLFSMERLSNNPFPIRRLHPQNDTLPFEVDNDVVRKLVNASLAELHAAGQLFIADHSYQKKYPGVQGRFNAACTAYFFINNSSGDLLPLAIKTNVGSDLVYTPLDDKEDWLLAKIMFNVNDLFHGQVLHLINSHSVAEIVHEAALRTMSAHHPVRGYLDNIMYQAHAIRPVGEKALFNPGGLFDQNFALTSEAVKRFEDDFYPTVGGPFQANYFRRSLVDRGLVNCSYGPELAHFPFAEDSGATVDSLRDFATAFVESYYPEDNTLFPDKELQRWIGEASGDAKVIDFPSSPVVEKETLIDILTHMAYLTSVNHHTLNGASLAASSAVLPFHPMALHQELPTAKGVKSVLPYLPNLNASISQVALTAGFIRPQWFNSQRDLQSIFEGSEFTTGISGEVKEAVRRLSDRLTSISEGIQARKFDDKGLAQGMPFIWRNLDPRKIPFFLYV